ncbi:MAG: polysaccharide pyruvyl transferase family protein, partial [Anaerolineales bacterium]
MHRFKGQNSVIVIAGYFGYGNLGDEAILTGMLEDLKDTLPQAECVVVSGDPAQTTKSHGKQAVGWDDLPSIIEAVRNSDLLIVGGGGLFHDYWPIDSHEFLSSATNGLASYLSLPLLSAMLRKPSMAYSVGVGPLRSASARNYVRFAFDSFSAIAVRDDESAALLRSLRANLPSGADPVVTADPAFLLKAVPIDDARAVLSEAGVDLRRPVCGVNLRHWDFGVDPARWESEVAQALDRWAEQHDGQIVFVPLQQAIRTPYEDDRLVCERVQAAMRSESRMLGWQREPELAAAVFAVCTVNLTMRMHGALFSLLGGVPAVGLSYDNKVANLFKRANLASFSFSIETLNALEICEALNLASAMRNPDAMAAVVEEMRDLAGHSTQIAVELLESAEVPQSGYAYGFSDLAFEKAFLLNKAEEIFEAFELRVERLLKHQSQDEGTLEIAAHQPQDHAGLESLNRQLGKIEDQIRKAQIERRNERKAMKSTITELRSEREDLRNEIDATAAMIRSLQSTVGMKILAKYWLW